MHDYLSNKDGKKLSSYAKSRYNIKKPTMKDRLPSSPLANKSVMKKTIKKEHSLDHYNEIEVDIPGQGTKIKQEKPSSDDEEVNDHEGQERFYGGEEETVDFNEDDDDEEGEEERNGDADDDDDDDDESLVLNFEKHTYEKDISDKPGNGNTSDDLQSEREDNEDDDGMDDE